MCLPIALLALCTTVTPLGRATAFEKVTEARVRAAFADARSAVEGELGAHFDEALALHFVNATELAQRIAEENLPQVRLRQPDEEKAKAEAKALGDSARGVVLAKYCWGSHEVLVALKTWDLQARVMKVPTLTADEALRAVLVHELVHAWDDSVYGLTAFFARGDSRDAADTITAIMEGHAQHVARRVCMARAWSVGFDTFTGLIGAIPESSKELGEQTLASLRMQAASAIFAYHDGEHFVAALEAASGAEAVTRAFREPPRDGETILHPEWFLDPKKRPVLLYNPEPALDLFVARLPGDVWSAQRQTLQSTQLEAAFALLPKEESRPVLASIRNAKIVQLYPTANPAAKLVVLTVYEFGTAAEARAYVDAQDRLSKLCDERMKTGVARITGSTTGTIEAGDASGLLHTKQMVNGTIAYETTSIDLARGELVVETTFIAEPIETETHAKLAVELLNAVKKRELK